VKFQLLDLRKGLCWDDYSSFAARALVHNHVSFLCTHKPSRELTWDEGGWEYHREYMAQMGFRETSPPSGRGPTSVESEGAPARGRLEEDRKDHITPRGEFLTVREGVTAIRGTATGTFSQTCLPFFLWWIPLSCSHCSISCRLPCLYRVPNQ